MIEQIADEGFEGILVVPVTFTSDHIETAYGLDVVERARAVTAGIEHYEVASGLNCHPLFISALAETATAQMQVASGGDASVRSRPPSRPYRAWTLRAAPCAAAGAPTCARPRIGARFRRSPRPRKPSRCSRMDHLLRTLAAVPPLARVLHVGCGDGSLTADIARLGFEVWACDPEPEPVRDALASVLGPDVAETRVSRATPESLGFADETFDWVVVWFEAAPSPEAFAELSRVMCPGSWVWAGAPAIAPEALETAASGAGLALSERAVADERDGTPVVRGIFRRVGDGVRG